MLLEFSCSNHKSIRHQIVFSAVANSDTTFEERNISFEKNRVLRSAVIYGANGSGKSNFISAVNFVKHLVLNSISYQPGQGIRQTPHKLDGFEKESTYSLQFVVKNIRYAYGFTLEKMLVTEEYLYYFPNGRQTRIFERHGEEIEPGSKFRSKFNACKDVLKPNRLMLSCAANFSSSPEVAAAYSFFSDDLVIYSSNNNDDWMNYSLRKINDDDQLKETVLKFMRSLDINLKDIRVNIKRSSMETLDISQLSDFLSDEFKRQILKNGVDEIKARIVYDEFDTDFFYEESTGVRKLFAMLCPIIDIIENGRVLFCDEFEANLHESLVYGLIREFLNLDANKYKFSQIFFTTHETGLLDLSLFRRDQIWFTEMKSDGRETELYSLSDIKNIRKDENVGRGYISGRYGAIPMLNIDFANIISSNSGL